MSLNSTSGISDRQAFDFRQPCDLWFQEAWRVVVFESIIHDQVFAFQLEAGFGSY